MKTWKKGASGCEKHGGTYGNKDELSRKLLSTLNSNHQCNDVTIKLSDGEIGATKIILSARSEYFSKMFDCSNNFLEADGIVNMPQYKTKIMKRVLEYLYGGDVHFADFSLLEAVELLDLLRMLMLSEEFEAMKDDITGILEGGIECRDDEVKSYLADISEIERYKIKDVLDGILFTIRNYSEFILCNCTDEIGTMSFEVLKILLGYFTNNMDRFQLMKIWYGSHPEEHALIEQVKKFVILQKINAEDLMGKVRESNLFTSDELLDALYKKHLDLKRFLFKNNLRCMYHQQNELQND